jgi:hypothetical protein
MYHLRIYDKLGFYTTVDIRQMKPGDPPTHDEARRMGCNPLGLGGTLIPD